MRLIFSLSVLVLALWSCGGDSTTTTAVNATPPSNTASTPSTRSAVPANPGIIKAFQPNASSPKIEVTVDGLSSGTAFLIGFFQGQNYRLDSASINANGRMVFQRQEPYPSSLVYVVLNNNQNFQMLIDEDQEFKMSTQLSDLNGAMKVEGSVSNQLLYEAAAFEATIRQKTQANRRQLDAISPNDPLYQELMAKREALTKERLDYLNGMFEKHPNTFFTAFKKAGQNPDIQLSDYKKPNGEPDTSAWVYNYRTKFWDDVNLYDERLMYTPVIPNKLKRYINELTPQRPDSINTAASFLIDKVLDSPEYFKYFANWVTMNYDPKESTLMDAQAVYVHMIQNYFTKELAFWSDSMNTYGLQQRAYEMAASLVGKQGPDVVSTDIDGKQRSIYEIKAPYIIVYMYNPTCEHCAVETPKLVSFYKEWKKKGVEVFGIAIDTNDKEWRDYVAKNKMEWINVYDSTNKSIYAKYFVDVTPEIYVLNPERTIIAKNLKVEQIEQMITRDMARKR